MDCKNCVKEDVCDQKSIFKEIEKNIENMFIDGHSMKNIAIGNGITAEVHCRKAVKKQAEFSPGWTNANDTFYNKKTKK